MASFKDSFMGGLSGKIGPVVIYMRKGQQIVRSNNTPKDPKTPKQLAHRMKFSLSNKGLSPLNRAIKMGHRGDTDAYRKIVGKAYHEAIVGEYPEFSIDYSKIKIADGELQSIADVKAEFDSTENSVTFSWKPIPKKGSGPARSNDQVNIVYFNEKDRFADHFSGVARRSDGKVSITLPGGWDISDTCFWIYMSSHDLQMNSESVFIKLY